MFRQKKKWLQGYIEAHSILIHNNIEKFVIPFSFNLLKLNAVKKCNENWKYLLFDTIHYHNTVVCANQNQEIWSLEYISWNIYIHRVLRDLHSWTSYFWLSFVSWRPKQHWRFCFAKNMTTYPKLMLIEHQGKLYRLIDNPYTDIPDLLQLLEWRAFEEIRHDRDQENSQTCVVRVRQMGARI